VAPAAAAATNTDHEATAIAISEDDGASDARMIELLIEDSAERNSASADDSAEFTVSVTPQTAPDTPAELTCPACRKASVLCTRLSDGRRKCPFCSATFMPSSAISPDSSGDMLSLGSSGSLPSLPVAPSRPSPPKKPRPRDDDDDDYGDGVRMTGKQKLIIGLSAAAVGLILLYFFWPSSVAVQSFFATTPAPREPVRVSADDLFREYAKDANAAEQKYSNTPIVVGEVGAVLDKGKRVRIKIKGGKYVDAAFQDASDDIQVSKTIAFRGEIEGFNRGALMVINCRLIPGEAVAEAQKK
jgi:hypothetical protein